MQKARPREEIIEAIHRPDHFGLHKLSSFIAGFKSVNVLGNEGEGTDYEDG